MSHSLRTALAALGFVYSLGLACVPFEEAEKEFCENAGPEQQHLCPQAAEKDGGTKPAPSDGGAQSDAGDGGPQNGTGDGGSQDAEDAGSDAGTPACVTESDCAIPPGPCLNSGACVGGQCVYPLATDGTSCSGPHPEQCSESTGTCMSGSCVYVPKTSGGCDDGNTCTTGDACNASGACVGTVSVCNTPPKQCYEPAGTCSPVSGKCSYALKPNSATCDDGNPCTTNDKCDGAGACAGTPMACNSPTNQCHQPSGTCSNGTCTYSFKPAGTSCDDGNPCTLNDQCNSAAICAGTTKPCNTPPPQCHESTGTCNTSTGACSYPPKPSGAACNDNNACTLSDSCDGNGHCVEGGTPLTCNDVYDECLIATGCHPSEGCTYKSRCTANESCQRGVCCPGTAADASSEASGVSLRPICWAEPEP